MCREMLYKSSSGIKKAHWPHKLLKLPRDRLQRVPCTWMHFLSSSGPHLDTFQLVHVYRCSLVVFAVFILYVCTCKECTWICSYGGVHVCMWAHVCACMQRPEVKIGYLSLSLFTLFIETESLLNLEIIDWLDWLANELKGSACLSPSL